ncbi:MAG TPA: hypothetical protein VLF41_00885 [Candidatus Nanoarchaeia archaeon]|nr:hypothetical protein [Candidatus Nanoarchaeia archaeon]
MSADNQLAKSRLKQATRVVVVVLVLLALVVGLNYNDREYWKGRFGFGRKVAAKIDNQVIYLDDYNSMIAEIHKVYGDDSHKGDYIEVSKRVVVSQKLNVKPAAQDIVASQKKLFPKPGTYNFRWQGLASFGDALPTAVARAAKGNYLGAFLSFPYSARFEASGKNLPGFKDAARIASDKQYAGDRATFYRDKIVSGQISDDTALAQIRADSRLKYGDGSNDSQVFGKSGKSLAEDLNNNSELIKYIISLQTGVTKVQTKKVASVVTGQPEDGDVYFVDLRLAQAPQPDLQSRYDKALKNLRVRVYVK